MTTASKSDKDELNEECGGHDEILMVTLELKSEKRQSNTADLWRIDDVGQDPEAGPDNPDSPGDPVAVLD